MKLREVLERYRMKYVHCLEKRGLHYMGQGRYLK